MFFTTTDQLVVVKSQQEVYTGPMTRMSLSL